MDTVYISSITVLYVQIPCYLLLFTRISAGARCAATRRNAVTNAKNKIACRINVVKLSMPRSWWWREIPAIWHGAGALYRCFLSQKMSTKTSNLLSVEKGCCKRKARFTRLYLTSLLTNVNITNWAHPSQSVPFMYMPDYLCTCATRSLSSLTSLNKCPKKRLGFAA